MNLKSLVEFFFRNPFARSSAILFVGTMTANVINYAFHLVIGRMVTPEVYGETESLISLLAVASVPALAISVVATRYAARAKADMQQGQGWLLFNYLKKKILLFGSGGLLLSMLAAPLIRDFLNLHSVIPVLLILVTIFLTFFSSAIVGIFNGWQSFSKANALNILSTSVKFVSGVLLVFSGLGATGVSLSIALSAVASYCIGVVLLRSLLGRNPTSEMPASEIPFDSLRSYVLPAFFGALGSTVLGNIDMMFARHALDPALAGTYGALSVAAKTIFFATGVLTTVLFSVAAERSHRQDDTKKLFFSVFFATAAIAFGATLVFSLVPELVLRILFGPTYLHASGFLWIFSITASVYALANLTLQYLLSLHHTRSVMFFLLVSGLEILALSVFGDGIYGIIGITLVAQIAAVIGGIVFVFFRKETPYAQEHFDRRPDIQ